MQSTQSITVFHSFLAISKLSITTLTSFLFFLISVPCRSISDADNLLEITDTERFWTCFETTLKLLGCLLGMPKKISDVLVKEDISGKDHFLDKSFVKRI